MNTRCVLQEDSFENDEVFKSTLFFPCGKIFVLLQTCTLFHKLCFFLTFHHVRLTNNSGLSLHSTDWKSTVKAKIFKGMYETNWNFQRDGGFKPRKPLCGRSMGIFWNNTLNIKGTQVNVVKETGVSLWDG